MITCYFENGAKTSLRHVCVTAIINNQKNKVLLVKRGFFQGKKIPEHGKWALVGGYLERNETLVQGLKREVKEETGFLINHLKLFRINDSPKRPNEDKQNVEIIFLAEAGSRLKVQNEEVLDQRWFNLNKLPAKNKIAFDHWQTLQLYQKYLTDKLKLPL